MRRLGYSLLLLVSAGAGAQRVPAAPSQDAKAQTFRDGKAGVQFAVPAGWGLYRKDGLVSTLHSDARTAARAAQMRAVASMEFNPFPESVLSGATFYFSVARGVDEGACAEQPGPVRDIQDIGGVEFRHAHDERGELCTESRDEVYTAYRKGSCFRFDLVVNTFCSVSSGAADLSERQLRVVEQQMVNVLSSVEWDWNKGGAHTVPLPVAPAEKPKEPELKARPLTPERTG